MKVIIVIPARYKSSRFPGKPLTKLLSKPMIIWVAEISCLTGTDRLAEVAKKIDADIYINVQGDEPLVNPEDIQKVIDLKKQYPNDVINGYTKMEKNEDPQSLTKPKIIFTEDKRMIYISRQPIPGFKDQKYSHKVYFKQVCIYAFNREELFSFGNFGRKSKLEELEDIEIIRFFEWGKTIRLVETQSGSLAVDVPEDVRKVENILKNK